MTYHHALVLVELVDSEGPGTVLADRQGLGAVAQLVGGAVAVRAAAGVVGQVNDGNAVHLHGVHAVPVVVAVGHLLADGRALESLISHCYRQGFLSLASYGFP